MQRSNLTLKDQIYYLYLETDTTGQVDGHNTWIPARYGGQKMLFTLQHYIYRPVTWNDLAKVTNQNCWSSSLEGPRYAYLEGYSAIGQLQPDLFGLLNFSIVFQWRGHDLISDLRSPNKKILATHFGKLYWLTPHAKFQNPRSWTVGPREGQSRTYITSIDLTWWPDLT